MLAFFAAFFACNEGIMIDVQVAKNVGKGKSPEACEALFNKHQVYLSLAPEHQNETAFAAMAATQDQVRSSHPKRHGKGGMITLITQSHRVECWLS